MEDKDMLGHRIKKIRKSLKLSQEDLAGDDFTKSYISKIERGLVNPSMKALEIIASRLNKPISYFVSDSNQDTFDPTLILDGQKLYEQKKHDESLDKFNQVLEFKDKLDDEQLVRIYYYVADIYLKQKKYDISADICNEALNALERLEDLYFFKLYYILGNAYYYLDRRQDALDKLLKCEKELLRYNIFVDIPFKFDLLHDIAVLYVQMGKSDLSKEYFQRIINISKKEKIITKTVISSLTAFSEIAFFIEKDPDKSLSYLNTNLLWIYEYFEDYYYLCDVYSKYVNAYLGKNEIEKTIEYFDKLEKTIPMIDDEFVKSEFEILALIAKGHIAIKQNNFVEAEKALSNALKRADEYKIYNIKVSVMLDLAQLYFTKNDFQTALDYLLECEELSNKIEFTVFLPDIYQLLGKIYFQTGGVDKGQEYYDKAFKLLKQ